MYYYYLVLYLPLYNIYMYNKRDLLSAIDLFFTHSQFDSKIICFFNTNHFPYDGQMVPGLAKTMERTTNLSTIYP